MAFNSFLKQTASIKELVPLKDAQGGVYQTWNTVASAKCLVQPISGGIERDEAKDGSAATHNILLGGSFSLSAKNQIHVGVHVYNVIRCNDWNSLGHHTTVECVLETS